MKVYVIRQISTGFYFPNTRCKNGRRGSTHRNFAPNQIPKIFSRRNTAAQCLYYWLLGDWNEFTENDGTKNIIISHRPERDKNDYEIVEMFLCEN